MRGEESASMDGAKLRYAALKTTEGFSFPFLSLIPLIPVSQSVSRLLSGLDGALAGSRWRWGMPLFRWLRSEVQLLFR